MEPVKSTNRLHELMRCVNQLNRAYQRKIIGLFRPSRSSAPPNFKAQPGTQDQKSNFGESQ